MNRLLILCVLVLASTASIAEAQAQQLVVHLKNGSVVRGVITEQVPNEHLRIETLDGNVFIFQMMEIDRITQDTSPGARPPGLESWYMYWALGWANPSYPDGLDGFTSELEDAADTHMKFDLDLLGIYFPLKSNETIIGGVINGAADGYIVEDELVQFNQYLYGLSAMHFITDYIGRGVFARADVGFARMVPVSSSDLYYVSDSELEMIESDTGYGFLIGGGYAFQITRGTRLLLNANYSWKSIGGEAYGKLNVSLGGLF